MGYYVFKKNEAESVYCYGTISKLYYQVKSGAEQYFAFA